MQETRQQILDILRKRGKATVDEIVNDLEARRGSITAVTVRHHLTVLQKQHLVSNPDTLQRSTPGRPQHVYQLTDLGLSKFPNNYQHLTKTLLSQIKANLSDSQTNVILEGVAHTMADEANIPDGTFEDKLDAVTEYLNEHGYDAKWESCVEGYILKTANCPYYQEAHKDQHLCNLDMNLIAQMLGVVPRLISRIADNENTCTYFLPLSISE